MSETDDKAGPSLEQFLRQLGTEGELEREDGEFTLSTSSALAKMESHRLVDAGLYVLEFLSLAVASGAKNFSVGSDSDCTRILFDGEPLQAQHLADPAAFLLGHHPDLRLTHFSLGMSGAKASAEGRAVRFCNTLGDSLTLDKGKWRVGTGLETSKFNKLVVARPYQFVSDRLRRRPTLAEVMDVGGMAPLNIKVDDKWLYRSFHPASYGREQVGCMVLKGQEEFKRYVPGSGLQVEEEAEHSFTAVLFFGDEAKAAEQGLVMLRLGIPFRVDSRALGPGVSAVVVSRELRRDLSGTSIVQDAHYQSIVKALQAAVNTFCLTLVKSEFRSRIPSLKLRSLIASLPTCPEFEKWLADHARLTELSQRALSPEAIRNSLAEDQEGRLELALAHAESVITGTDRYWFDRVRVIQELSDHEWIKEISPDEPLGGEHACWQRLGKFRELVALARGVLGKSYREYLPLDPLTHNLLLRADGRQQDALRLLGGVEECLAGESAVHLLDLWLWKGEYQRVIEACLKQLKAQNVKDVVAYSRYERPSLWAEYLAFALQLSGQTGLAPIAYSALLNYSYDSFTNYLRAEYWCRLSRGSLPFGQWLLRRAKVSGMGAYLFVSFQRHNQPRILSALDKGKVPAQGLRGALTQYFSNSGAIYEDLFECVSRQAVQQLRLAGQAQRADRLAAHGHLLARLRNLRQDFLTPGED